MKKWHNALFFIFFILLGSYFYGSEYFHFIQDKNIHQDSLRENTFSGRILMDEISDISDVSFYATPDLNFLDFLVDSIDASTQKIYVNMYIFTEKRLRDALIQAKKRGVEVKVILEKNVYLAPHLNNTHYNLFEEGEVQVKWSDPKKYSLNHAKFFIIDDTAYISTGNFSYTSFKSNTDFYVNIRDAQYVEHLENIFYTLFSGLDSFPQNRELFISPYSSRYVLMTLLKSAKKDIKIYMPYLSDEETKNILTHKIDAGVSIEIITNAKEKDEDIVFLEENGAQVKYQKGTVHAKSILIDGELLSIGSVNFSKQSYDENFEIGILIKNKDLISQFLERFNNDFYK